MSLFVEDLATAAAAGDSRIPGGAAGKHLICMVGLPARGKTYISLKLANYLNWVGVNCKVFNVGMYRRKVIKQYKFHDFFPVKEAMEVRQRVADIALEEALNFLHGEGTVAILDATNVTLEGRRVIHDRVVNGHNLACLFIESVCDNPDLIMANIAKVKVQLPDYEGVDMEEATQDFIHTIERYKELYIPMSKVHESDLSYIKIINAGEKLVLNRSHCNLDSRIGYWLMNVHITARTIYLAGHGEMEARGGVHELTAAGRQYAGALAKYMEGCKADLCIWTSHSQAAVQTTRGIPPPTPQNRWKALDKLKAGAWEGLSTEEIRERYPAESYQEVISRLEPVVLELERRKHCVLVVASRAVLRCLLGYFAGTPLKELPHLAVPLHTLVKISPVSYGCEVEYIPLGVIATVPRKDRLADNHVSVEITDALSPEMNAHLRD